MHILDKIFQYKKKELAKQKEQVPLSFLQQQMKDSACERQRGFIAALTDSPAISIIAEYKTASPSMGAIIDNPDMNRIIADYVAGGARAISVLTDNNFFNGKLEYLQKIRKIATVPLLRKDFIFDPYQIYESKLHGADAILLIVQMLNNEQLTKLTALAKELELDVLFEAHDKDDIKRILSCEPAIIGINSRDLKTMKVDIKNIAKLIPLIPENVAVVAESGIKTKQDINYVRSLNVKAVLIGTFLMKSDNPYQTLKELQS